MSWRLWLKALKTFSGRVPIQSFTWRYSGSLPPPLDSLSPLLIHKTNQPTNQPTDRPTNQPTQWTKTQESVLWIVQYLKTFFDGKALSFGRRVRDGRVVLFVPVPLRSRRRGVPHLAGKRGDDECNLACSEIIGHDLTWLVFPWTPCNLPDLLHSRCFGHLLLLLLDQLLLLTSIDTYKISNYHPALLLFVRLFVFSPPIFLLQETDFGKVGDEYYKINTMAPLFEVSGVGYTQPPNHSSEILCCCQNNKSIV